MQGDKANEKNLILEAGLDELPVPVLIGDSARKMIWANKAWEHLTGYSKSEIIGHSCDFLQRPPAGTSGAGAGAASEKPKDVIDHSSEISKALAGSGSYEGTIRNFKKDGTPFENHLTIRPVRVGSVSYFIATTEEVGRTRRFSDIFSTAKASHLLDSFSSGKASHLLDSASSMVQSGERNVSHLLAEMGSLIQRNPAKFAAFTALVLAGATGLTTVTTWIVKELWHASSSSGMHMGAGMGGGMPHEGWGGRHWGLGHHHRGAEHTGQWSQAPPVPPAHQHWWGSHNQNPGPDMGARGAEFSGAHLNVH